MRPRVSRRDPVRAGSVRTKAEEKPGKIGLLQRYATDYVFEKKIQLFTRAKATGKKIAIVGAGPAGLLCAHKISMLGHEVEIFEAKPKADGLNEYGIAAYKMLENFAQKEVNLFIELGGIQIHYEQALGRDFILGSLRQKFDAVFLAARLAGVNALKLEGENLPGVLNAVESISQLRQAEKYADLKIGKRIVVIGGGNTAIDIAFQAKALGAEEVTLIYRRGASDMSATPYEQELAQRHGVLIKLWAKPLKVKGDSKGVSGVVFEKTRKNTEGNLLGNGEQFTLETDVVFKAVGQVLLPNSLGLESEVLEFTNGKIEVNAMRRTSLVGVYAGGDCIAHSEDLTVVAVQEGKLAAHAIDLTLSSRGKGIVQNG